jgi:hypothetical protein
MLMDRTYGRPQQQLEVTSLTGWAAQALDELRSVSAGELLERFRRGDA